MVNFEVSISEILEVPQVKMEDHLDSFDTWDSLTVLSIIAFCDSEFGVALSADEINASETIQGLKDLIDSRIALK